MKEEGEGNENKEEINDENLVIEMMDDGIGKSIYMKIWKFKRKETRQINKQQKRDQFKCQT